MCLAFTSLLPTDVVSASAEHVSLLRSPQIRIISENKQIFAVSITTEIKEAKIKIKDTEGKKGKPPILTCALGPLPNTSTALFYPNRHLPDHILPEVSSWLNDYSDILCEARK